jgi:hypothetical protein
VKRFRVFLRVLGLGVLLYLLSRRVDPAAVSASWQGISGVTALFMAALFCSAMSLRLFKWNLQMRHLGFSFDRITQARNFLWGILIGIVTPMRVGELYRLAALHEKDRLGVAGASLVLEKGYELLVLLSLVVVGGAFVLPTALPSLIFAPILFVGLWFALGSLRPPFPLPERLERVLAPLLQARDGLALPTRLGLLGLTALAQGLNMLASLQLYRAFGDMDLWLFIFGGPTVTLTTAIPITISGIGLRELAAMEVFGRAGFPPDAAAVTASLTFLGANVLPCAAILPLELWAAFRSRAESL